MNAIKSSSFLGLRPSSRASSPGPSLTVEAPASTDKEVGTLASRGRVKTLSSLAPFRRTNSPAPSLPAIPTPALTPQDGNYLSVLGLRLSEAVSKAVAQPTGPAPIGEPVVDGKRALPAGRGRALASLIVNELHATEANPQLHRATLRLLHRPLSVLLTTLNTSLLPLLTSPSFSSTCSAHSAPQTVATQTLALSIAGVAVEVLEGFDTLSLGTQSDSLMRGAQIPMDGLKSIRDGLESIISRVAGPLVAYIKGDLCQAVEGLDASPIPSPSLSKTSVMRSGSIAHPNHPFIIKLSQIVPLYARALLRATSPPSAITQNLLATCVISVVWRALVALSNRSVTLMARTPTTTIMALPTPSPPLSPPNQTKKWFVPTPPATPSANRFLAKLPTSRPPSPTQASGLGNPIVSEAKTILDLLESLPKPVEQYSLANGAVTEALQSLQGLYQLLQVLTNHQPGSKLDISDLALNVPTLTALPLLLQVLPDSTREQLSQGSVRPLSVAIVLGMDEAEYRGSCLSGFGRAGECGPLVARKFLDIFNKIAAEDVSSEKAAIADWLHARSTV